MNTPLQTSTTQEPARQVGPLVRPRYWVCVIGPIPHGALPEGADLPPRISARRAVEESTGCETSRITNSGWCDEAEYLRIMDARYGPNES